jgi:hypothetical protein
MRCIASLGQPLHFAHLSCGPHGISLAAAPHAVDSIAMLSGLTPQDQCLAVLLRNTGSLAVLLRRLLHHGGARH